MGGAAGVHHRPWTALVGVAAVGVFTVIEYVATKVDWPPEPGEVRWRGAAALIGSSVLGAVAGVGIVMRI